MLGYVNSGHNILSKVRTDYVRLV